MVHHGRSFSSIYESQPAIFYLDGLGIWLIDKEVWSRTCPPPLQRTAWLFFRRCRQPKYKNFLQLMEANKCICVTISFFGHQCSGCCVTWWFIARVQAYFLSPLTCSPCHVNCECHIKLALKSNKSTENLSVVIVTFFPSQFTCIL